MAGRWIHLHPVSTLFRGCDDAFLGQVLRRGASGWLGWLLGWNVPEPDLGHFPTRAAAMRAVAGRCDAKKGNGLG